MSCVRIRWPLFFESLPLMFLGLFLPFCDYVLFVSVSFSIRFGFLESFIFLVFCFFASCQCFGSRVMLRSRVFLGCALGLLFFFRLRFFFGLACFLCQNSVAFVPRIFVFDASVVFIFPCLCLACVGVFFVRFGFPDSFIFLVFCFLLCLGYVFFLVWCFGLVCFRDLSWVFCFSFI